MGLLGEFPFGLPFIVRSVQSRRWRRQQPRSPGHYFLDFGQGGNGPSPYPGRTLLIKLSYWLLLKSDSEEQTVPQSSGKYITLWKERSLLVKEWVTYSLCCVECVFRDHTAFPRDKTWSFVSFWSPFCTVRVLHVSAPLFFFVSVAWMSASKTHCYPATDSPKWEKVRSGALMGPNYWKIDSLLWPGCCFLKKSL